MVSQHVVSHVKPNEHTYTMSSDLCCPHARLENLAHVRPRFESTNPSSGTAHKLIKGYDTLDIIKWFYDKISTFF